MYYKENKQLSKNVIVISVTITDQPSLRSPSRSLGMALYASVRARDDSRSVSIVDCNLFSCRHMVLNDLASVAVGMVRIMEIKLNILVNIFTCTLQVLWFLPLLGKIHGTIPLLKFTLSFKS